MAALTNKQVHEIERIIRSLTRGITFIKRDNIGIAYLQDRPATATSDYHSNDGSRSAIMLEKSYGSDLCGLYDALEKMKGFLITHKRK
ncbi:hypothetical protein [Xenorhabdus sp. KJ12.1]|uniref:hypothetical protein n=1 Tax=Xenorhabdus sp. KJ12.1 TaxID=1851571 RepID=UPI000C052FCF|nr:hypothetical protein [Xenorhabdus sp. KJ12.1]PHM72233.1 hypothetical protein Xekj_00511 [Xenorhabdus sp. KJ12.1]